MSELVEQQIISQGAYNRYQEKSFLDKILAKEDSKSTKKLVTKTHLTREELLELLYQLVETESKLVNYGEWDRYVMLKFFVWVREFIGIAELLFDVKEDLEKKQKYKMSERTKKLLFNNERLIEHNAKFLVDVYLNIARTSLSLGATGFLEFLRNKFEISYPQQSQNTEEKKPSIFGMFKGGK